MKANMKMKKLLALLLTVGMMLTMTLPAFAVEPDMDMRTSISIIRATSAEGVKPVCGQQVTRPQITLQEGSPATFIIANWYRLNEEKKSWRLVQVGDTFTEGTYTLMGFVRVTGDANKTHVLAKDVKVYVDDVEWVGSEPEISEDKSERAINLPPCQASKFVIKDVDTDATEVKGLGEPATSVVVTFPSGRQGRTGTDQNGNWRVSLPDGEVLQVGDLIKAKIEKQGQASSIEAHTTVKAGKTLAEKNNIILPDKTKVEKPEALTREEKAAVAEAIREANPNLPLADLVIGDDGSATLTYTDQSSKTIPGSDLVEDKRVKQPTIKDVYTDATAIEGTGEPGASIIVTFPSGRQGRTGTDQDGKWRVSLPDGERLAKDAVIKARGEKDGKDPSEEVSTQVKERVNVPLEAKEPSKTEVKNPAALTDEEKQAVRDAIKEANKDLGLTDNDIDVKDDGSVVISKDGKTGNLTPAQTIREKATSPGTSGGGSSFIIPKDDKGTVEELKDHKAYIFGYEDGTVRPDGKIKRAEAAAMVARLMGYDLSDVSKPKFADTNGWYNNVINAVVKAGLMTGYEDGSFRPDAPITRAEFAKVIQKIDKQNTTDNLPFADVKGHWAHQAITQAYANGRISGYPDGSFKPERKISRAEAASILNAVFDRKVAKEGLAKVDGKVKTFPDLQEDQWYYYDMVEAINSHAYHKADQAKSESWQKVK